ncbi:MAG: pectate lyase [Candidatus Malihini olakiniferum]
MKVYFDKRNNYSQIEYIAQVYKQVIDASYRDAALHGINYRLNQQYNVCDGWPHTVPPKYLNEMKNTDYQHAITHADDATSGI